MARYGNVQTDFSGGLISDYVLGRTDIKRVANSGRVFKNFFPTLQGPAVFRTGFKNYGGVDLPTAEVTSVDVILATDQPYRVVFSSLQIQVYNKAGELLDTLDSPYSSSDILDLRFSSETNELHLAHGRHRPKVLTADVILESRYLVSSDGFDLYSTAGFGVETTFSEEQGYEAGLVALHPEWEGRDTNASSQWQADPANGRMTCTGNFKNIRTTSKAAGSVGDVIKTSARFNFGSSSLSTDDERVFMFSLAEMDAIGEETNENVLSNPNESFTVKFLTSNSVPTLKLINQGDNTVLGTMPLADVEGDDLECEIEITIGTTNANTEKVVTLRSITDSTEISSTLTGVSSDFYNAIIGGGVKTSFQCGELADTTATQINIDSVFFRNTTTFGTDTPFQLFANAEIQGDGSWTLSDKEFDVEPFLEIEPSTDNYNISQNERYVKITTSTPQFNAIVGAADPTDFYVQYISDGTKFLGKVVNAASSNNYDLEDPTNSVVYVEPVVSVLEIEDNSAQLYLLDNVESAGSTDQIRALEADGVPTGEIHLRSDALIFNAGFSGSWVCVDDDRRNDNVVRGHNRTRTRWVRIDKHLGTQDHPVEFFRGNFDFRDYSSGSVYRIYGDLGATLYSIGPDVDGNLDIVTGIVTGSGNRTFTFVNKLTTDKAGASNFGGSVSVGNLSTQKQFDVVKCFATSDDIVEEYDSTDTANPGNLIVIPDTTTTTLNLIANDAILDCNKANTFSTTDVGRHMMGTMESGNVFMKVVRFNSTSQVTVELVNSVPRDPRTLAFENGGNFEEFRKGAWFSNNFPRTVAKFEQRRVYGGTFETPNFVFYSRSGDERSFQPTQDDKTVLDTDAITYPLANRNASIRWMNAARDLVLGTTGGIYRIVPNQYQYGISPKTIRMELTEEEPCDRQGETIGSSIFYPDQSGTRLLEYKYDQSINNSSSNDVTKLIYPIFLEDSIEQIAYQHTPQPRIWARTVSGKLYCLSYHRQEEFYAWSEQDLGSNTKVLDISVMHRGSATGLDQVWIVADRDNETYFEALAETDPIQLTSYPMLDSYLELVKPIDGSISTDVSPRFGAGDTVAVIEDDVYIGEQTLTSDNVTLNNPSTAQRVFVGLRYTGELQMMFPTWDGSNKPAYGSSTARVISVKPFLINSWSYRLGVKSSFETITVSEQYGADGGFTGFDKERPVSGSTYGVDNVPTIKHEEPYPLTIASLTTKTDLN